MMCKETRTILLPAGYIHTGIAPRYGVELLTGYIRESVDSLCRDGVDTPMPPYIGKAFTCINFEDLSLF